MKNRLVKKLLAGTLAMAMAGSMTVFGAGNVLTTDVMAETTDEVTEEEMAEIIAAAAGTGTAEGVDKTETVYVFTDANGETKNITVSGHLKNTKKKDVIEDKTSLQDVTSVEGNAVFTREGEEYTWTTNGEDVYYQGTTDQEPPVGTRITYFLDGREVSPEEIAGKKGSVKIRIDYTNNEKVGDVYVPFTAVTGMVFAEDDVDNVKVDNGTVVSEGRNTVVIGMGFPGLAESLKPLQESTENDLRSMKADGKLADRIEKIDIPSSVEVTMDAANFKMGLCMTMVFSNLLSGDDAENEKQSAFDDLDSSVNDLLDNGQKLADGASRLSDGIGTAYDAVPEFVDGIGALADGIKAYTDGVGQVNDGVIALANGAASAKAGASQLETGVKDYTDGAGQVAGGAKQVADGAANAKSGAQSLADGVSRYTKGASDVDAGARQLKEGSAAVKSGAEDLTKGINTYTDGVSALNDGAAAVDAGLADAEKGAEALSGGIDSAVDGSAALEEGLKQLCDAIAENGNISVADSVNTEEIGAAAREKAVEAVMNDQQISGALAQMEAAGLTEEQVGQVKALIAAAVGSAAEKAAAETAGAVAAGADQQLAPVITKLGSAASSLYAGAAQLSGGLKELQGGAHSLTGGLAALKEGSGKLAAGAGALNGSSADLKSGSAALAAGAGQLATGSDALAAGTGALVGSSEALNQGAAALADGLGTLSDGANTLSAGAGQLTANSDKLTEGAHALAEGLGTLDDGVGELADGTKQLAGNSGALNDGASKLSAGAGELSEGLKEILAGSVELKDGCIRLNDEGVKKLADFYRGDVKALDERIEALKNAGETYTTFAGAREGAESSVKFIYRADSI